ncbi:MAG: c-type cytochrome [Archangium sp.]|nr:c-type cytochrome [Archangium sp.]
MRLFGALLLLGSCAHVAPVNEAATLRFFENGADRGAFTLAQLRAQVPEETVSGFDPYYQRPKRWRALPLEPVLRLAFPSSQLATEEFTLRALDGYTVPISGARLLEGGAYLAFSDADGAWEPIGARRADPGPWYLVWKGGKQLDLTTHPRPWALASLSIEPFEAVFPLVVPRSKDPRVQQGFVLFRQQCVKCHAINQQGGSVGPELNVPKNVTEYRDEAFLRAWIRNPFTFRISVMPPSPQLTEDELSALLAYLAAMRDQKIDVAPGGH